MWKKEEEAKVAQVDKEEEVEVSMNKGAKAIKEAKQNKMRKILKRKEEVVAWEEYIQIEATPMQIDA